LVASGAYARCRHPIYVAYNAVFVGLGLAFGSWGVGVVSGALLLLLWIAYVLLIEEPKLRARYGSAYVDYARATPLIPILEERRARSLLGRRARALDEARGTARRR
jgi:protein-S-isoprenylcysteine O-methyltransferase Ste14